MELITRSGAAAAARATLRLHPQDDVLIARQALVPGLDLPEEGVQVREPVPAGHKVAVRAIAAGAPVRRYGQIIGFAREAIAAGSHVHVHNLAMGDFTREHAFGIEARGAPAPIERSFLGIVRPDGRVATRNYIGILTSVNCSATVARAVADHFRRDVHPAALGPYANVDGVVALTHGVGCGIDTQGEGMAVLRRTLGGYASHPNFAAVLFIGLGCEANQIPTLLADQGLSEHAGLRTLNIQDSGGTTATVARGIAAVEALLPAANAVAREPVSARPSDPRPAVRWLGRLFRHQRQPGAGPGGGYAGGRRGHRHPLGNPGDLRRRTPAHPARASPAVGERLVERIRWWEDYCARFGASLDNNPSAGNKAGGLTTILEKSLGAVIKAGSTDLMAVYGYAEPVRSPGLVFMDTPGYDPVSATGQVAGGANLIAFTTGRGSAYGCAPTPSLKIATNTRLWESQRDDMDVDCGGLVDGSTTLEERGAFIFERLLALASGERSRSELHGYGQNEFVPWQLGATT